VKDDSAMGTHWKGRVGLFCEIPFYLAESFKDQRGASPGPASRSRAQPS